MRLHNLVVVRRVRRCYGSLLFSRTLGQRSDAQLVFWEVQRQQGGVEDIAANQITTALILDGTIATIDIANSGAPTLC